MANYYYAIGRSNLENSTYDGKVHTNNIANNKRHLLNIFQVPKTILGMLAGISR